MNVFQIWSDGYRNSFSYSGRESRRAYGLFLLLHFITMLALTFFLASIIMKSSDTIQGVAALIFIILCALLPMLSISIRRGHDCEINGWIIFAFSIVFFAGAIGALLVIPPKPGMGQPNQYGPDPRA